MTGLEEILLSNQKNNNKKKKYKLNIGIISNINLFFLQDIMSFELRKYDIDSKVQFCLYKNFAEDLKKNKHQDILIFFFEGLEFFFNFIQEKKKISDNEIEGIKKIVFWKLNKIQKFSNNKLLIINKLNVSQLDSKKFSIKFKKTISEINKKIESLSSKNIKFFDLEVLYKNLKKKEIYNFNDYYENKNLYKYFFLIQYFDLIKYQILKTRINFLKKVLILDCDNTLWNGLAVDTPSPLSENDKKNKIFFKARKFYNQLANNGVMLCLCSKNNLRDVDILIKDKRFKIEEKNIVNKKINWKNKYLNILNISKELNLSTNSFVFIDDTDFELKSVKKIIPEIECLKVPSNVKNYPILLQQLENLFSKKNLTNEDKNRNVYYLQDTKRKKFENKSKSFDEYISQLKIKIKYYKNDEKNVSRISQLFLRTNQFHLNEKRFSEREVKKILKSNNSNILTYEIRDIYGSYGITALILYKQQNSTLVIENFIMSCRILGRKIENKILSHFISNNISYFKKIIAIVKPTKKNSEFVSFYEKNNFDLIKNKKKTRTYLFNKKKNLNSKNKKFNFQIVNGQEKKTKKNI